jgi:dCMP deaminase
MDRQLKWDQRFLRLARFWANECSKDPSTKTCAVIVRPDRSIAGIGYNGFPQGTDDSPEIYENREEKLARIVHSEVNALTFVNEPVAGYTMYNWPFAACDRCTTQIIQNKIARYVAPHLKSSDLAFRWKKELARSAQMFREAGVRVDLIDIE